MSDQERQDLRESRADLAQRGKEIQDRLIVVAERAVFYRGTVLAGFAIQVAILVAILAGVALIVVDTNRSLNDQVVPLQDRILELEEQLVQQDEDASDQESIINQQTDAIVLLINTLQDNGINPPEIIIRPPED